jgi:hypothetical protein
MKWMGFEMEGILFPSFKPKVSILLSHASLFIILGTKKKKEF